MIKLDCNLESSFLLHEDNSDCLAADFGIWNFSCNQLQSNNSKTRLGRWFSYGFSYGFLWNWRTSQPFQIVHSDHEFIHSAPGRLSTWHRSNEGMEWSIDDSLMFCGCIQWLTLKSQIVRGLKRGWWIVVDIFCACFLHPSVRADTRNNYVSKI